MKNFLNTLLVIYQPQPTQGYNFIDIDTSTIELAPAYGYVFPFLSSHITLLEILLVIVAILVIVLIVLNKTWTNKKKIIMSIVTIISVIFVGYVLIRAATWTMPIEMMWWHE